jgi:phosphoribosyl 1,2-cyclic phosphate phosphodiesterase
VKTIAVVNDEPFQIGNKVAIPVNVMHGNLQVFGYRVDDFAYLTDVKTIDESEILKLKNLKVLVVNTLRESLTFKSRRSLDLIALLKKNIFNAYQSPLWFS